MTTRLDLIKFNKDPANVCDSYGFQEMSQDGKLLHLYDGIGEQLDNGNGFYPDTEWEVVRNVGIIGKQDDFWELISKPIPELGASKIFSQS